jgi:cold shock protein
MSDSQTGVVKWFNDGKGFGYITPEGGGADVFAHFSEIRSDDGFKTLKETQRVQFEIQDSPKGPRATNIRPV